MVGSHWVFDTDGHPTTDASAGLAGSLALFGGYKGDALALIVDILAAGVTGSSFTFEASSTAQTRGAPPNQGQLLIAIHPAAFGGTAFETRLEVLFAVMLTQGAFGFLKHGASRSVYTPLRKEWPSATLCTNVCWRIAESAVALALSYGFIEHCLTRLSKKSNFGIFMEKRLLKIKELWTLIFSVLGFFDSLN